MGREFDCIWYFCLALSVFGFIYSPKYLRSKYKEYPFVRLNSYSLVIGSVFGFCASIYFLFVHR